jgi:hypothetical protein
VGGRAGISTWQVRLPSPTELVHGDNDDAGPASGSHMGPLPTQRIAAIAPSICLWNYAQQRGQKTVRLRSGFGCHNSTLRQAL